MLSLPQTGTAELLNRLSPFLDDQFINNLFPLHHGRGRRHLFCPAQLFRVLLLNLLSPAHSFNLLVQLLAEHRPWREFAWLRNKQSLPDAKMLHQFRDRLDLVVADMAYINFAGQRRLREQFHVGVVTALRPDFDLAKEIEAGVLLRCRQGQELQWLGLHEQERLHWFGVPAGPSLCQWCWEQSQCGREFSFAPTDHETVFGTIPANSLTGRKLIRQVRSWIEATQAYEKQQLGLSEMFLNSLRLTWTLALLADTVSLLRAHAFLRQEPTANPLAGLQPNQLNLPLNLRPSWI